MKNASTISEDTKELPSYLIEQRQTNRIFRLWYRITSPPEPKGSTTFEERERFRRGRTGSQILLALFVLYLSAFPAAFAGTNIFLAVILVAAIIAMILATVLNQKGYVTLAGIIVVIAITASPVTNIVTTPGGLNSSVFPVFSILVLPLMCAVSFLPPWWVFVVAAGNCIFTLFAMTLLPHTKELDAVLNVAFAGIVTPIILSQMIVSVVAYLWVTGAVRAIMRADRAEEIARLEHDLALKAEMAAQQKEQLEASIQKVVDTHTRVANGDFSARVPLTRDNILWQISGSLNNLLSRLQRLRQDANELMQVKAALQQSREENRKLLRALGKTSI